MEINREKLLALIEEKTQSGEYTEEHLATIFEALRNINEYEKYNKLEFFKPLQKQREFFEAGSNHKFRFSCSANRCGKTHSGCYELSVHLTGRYPDDWKGRRFNHPITGWAVGISRKSAADSLQEKLLGTNNVKIGNEEQIGSGFIPRKEIRLNTIQRDGAYCETLRIKHYDQYGNYDGDSELSFKSCESGEHNLRGASVDFIIMDEEHPFQSMRIFSELQARTRTKRGSVVITATPENGMTELIVNFLNSEAKEYWFQQVGIPDVIPDLFSSEEFEEMKKQVPKWQQGYKLYGDPSVASGLIYPVDLETLIVNPFEIPNHWKQIAAMDMGLDHPTTCIWSAYDEDNDVIYITGEYGNADNLPPLHASRIKSHKLGEWLPVVLPHDAFKRSSDTGRQMIDTYRDLGLPVQYETFHNGYTTEGKTPNDVEVGLVTLYTRMREGKLKIFSTCQELLKQLRLYRMKDGKVIKENDDYCDAMRYSAMSVTHRGLSVASHESELNYHQDYVWRRY